MSSLVLLAIAVTTFPFQAPASDGPPVDNEAARRLEYLQDRLEEYTIQPAQDGSERFELRHDPLFRWSNPVSDKVDGGVFLWTQGERPMVIAKIHINGKQQAWGAAIQSLAPMAMIARRNGRKVWAPNESGLDFHTVPDGTSPDDSPRIRLVQMRSIARRFSITGIWGESNPQPWELRLISNPLYRYSATDQQILDGGVFAFTQGTNPEGIVVVEAVELDGQRTWRSAVTRLTRYALRPTFDGRSLEELPRLEIFPLALPFHHDWEAIFPYPFRLPDGN